jgi:poly(3-hydroxybutyrate) depolymerase
MAGRRIPYTALAAALLLTCGLAAGCGSQAAEPGQAELIRVRAAGLPRQAVLVPARSGEPAPLILAFHGLGSSGRSLLESLGDLPARSGASVVLPDALPCLVTAGAPCWPAEAGAPNLGTELAFVERLVDEVAGRVPVDRDRVLALGYSNGAGWAVRLVLQRPDLVSGAVAVAGFDPTRSFARDRNGLLALPLTPIGAPEALTVAGHPPLALIHGGEDEVVPPRLGRELLGRLGALGWPKGRARLEVVPGAGHVDERLLTPDRLVAALRWVQAAGREPA